LYHALSVTIVQKALEENRWMELEKSRERSARMMFGDKGYHQAATRLTSFNAVTLAS
jgi:hypothetical protein